MGNPYHIIGDADTVLGFSFAGVRGDAVQTADEARSTFRKAVSDSKTIVLILTEEVGQMLADEVSEHRQTAEPPYVTVIEGLHGPVGHRVSLQDLINEAVGVKLSNDDKEEQ